MKEDGTRAVQALVVKAGTLLLAIVAVPVLGAAALTAGQEPDSSFVTGETLVCPDGSEVQSVLSRERDAFTLTGTLISLDQAMVAVGGPEGKVNAIPTINAGIELGLQPGMPVTIEGQIFDQGMTFVVSLVTSACPGTSPTAPPSETPTPATSTPTPEPVVVEGECNRGPGQAGELRAELEGDEAEIERGTVLAVNGNVISVSSPFGPVDVVIVDGTEVDGDPTTASEVCAEGLLSEGTIIADEIKALCPDAAHEDEPDAITPEPAEQAVAPLPANDDQDEVGEDEFEDADEDALKGENDDDEFDADHDNSGPGSGQGNDDNSAAGSVGSGRGVGDDSGHGSDDD